MTPEGIVVAAVEHYFLAAQIPKILYKTRISN